jgi:hypothetical protein
MREEGDATAELAERKLILGFFDVSSDDDAWLRHFTSLA